MHLWKINILFIGETWSEHHNEKEDCETSTQFYLFVEMETLCPKPFLGGDVGAHVFLRCSVVAVSERVLGGQSALYRFNDLFGKVSKTPVFLRIFPKSHQGGGETTDVWHPPKRIYLIWSEKESPHKKFQRPSLDYSSQIFF